jgi:hypothetical protein
LSKIRHLQVSKVQHGSSGQRVKNDNIIVLAEDAHRVRTPRVPQNKENMTAKLKAQCNEKISY